MKKLHYLNSNIIRLIRNWPWPIKKKILRLPKIESCSSDTKVVVLCTPDKILEGLWSLYSIMFFLADSCEPFLVVDGDIPNGADSNFRKLFASGRIIDIDCLTEGMPLFYELEKFIETHWAGRKFKALYALQREHSILYIDNDVLIVNDPLEIRQVIESSADPVYMFDPSGYILDPWIKERTSKLGLNIDKYFNSGFLWLPVNTFENQLLSDILSGWKPENNSHFSEQTLISSFFQKEGNLHFNPEKYVISNSGYWIWQRDNIDLRHICARHYVGNVRHLMYTKAYPFLLRKWTPKDQLG